MKKTIILSAIFLLMKIALYGATASISGPHFACLGASITFSASLSSGTIDSCHWKKYGSVVFSSTTSNTYTKSSVTIGDSGSYTVVIYYHTGSNVYNDESNPYNLSIITVGAAIGINNLCYGAPLSITHATTKYGTGVPGIGSGPYGLPTGATVNWSSNQIIIGGNANQTGVFTYNIPYGGGSPFYGCSATGTITVLATNTAGTASPTLCINTLISPVITIATTGATGIGTITGLPNGVSAQWAGNSITISGTPNASGPFPYTILLTGGCGTVYASGTINVTANMTAGSASYTPTLCVNTAVNPNITHITNLATGISNDGVSTGVNGLPPGVSAHWAGNTITISGIPTASGTFNYSIPLTGGCGNVNATGTINVKAYMTAGTASSTPTLCINTAISPNITHTTTGATGIGTTTTGLPPGVSAQWVSNTITISGTPTIANTYNYSIPLTGGCGNVNATGTIIVKANMTAGAASSSPSLCINTAITPITHTTTSATGIGTPTGLPAGVSAQWAGNTITISGTPSVSGTFNYIIPLTGGCGSVNATGNIIVSPLQTISWNSNSGDQNQSLCAGASIIPVVFTYGGSANGVTVSMNPPGFINYIVNTSLKTITIFGETDTSGTYSITTSGICNPVTISGTITVPTHATLNTIVAKINTAGETYLLIYPNPPAGNVYYQWYENGNPIDGANEQFFYPPRYGLTFHPGSCYKVFVILSSYHDCGSFTDCNTIPGGKNLMMTIFPNPADGNFHLGFNKEINVTDSYLTIYSMEGQIVYEHTINNNDDMEINSTLRQGLYFVKLVTGDGNKFIEKLAIQ